MTAVPDVSVIPPEGLTFEAASKLWAHAAALDVDLGEARAGRELAERQRAQFEERLESCTRMLEELSMRRDGVAAKLQAAEERAEAAKTALDAALAANEGFVLELGASRELHSAEAHRFAITSDRQKRAVVALAEMLLEELRS